MEHLFKESRNREKIVVVGAGRSGIAASKLLRHFSQPIYLFDDKEEKDLRFFNEAQLKENELLITCFGQKNIPDLVDVKAMVLSPGVDQNHFLVKKALDLKIPVISEIDLAAHFLRKKIIGITGTNGKSTTTIMVESILNQAGIKAIACGNLGRPLCDVALDPLLDLDYIIVELSSFQLESSSSLKLDYAAILNITPNHLDRYKNFDEYKNAKIKIASLLKEEGKLVIHEDLEDFFLPHRQNVITFSQKMGQRHFPFLESLPIAGLHNRENAIAASMIARALHISDEHIKAGLSAYKPLPHRCELVIHKNGITFINDSKGTTVTAVLKALSMYQAPTHLLLGGIEKGEDFSVLNNTAYPHIRGYYVYGDAKEKIVKELNSPLATAFITLEQALQQAIKKGQSGDVILLSPGCASYDQFDDYHHRGETFKKLVMGTSCASS